MKIKVCILMAILMAFSIQIFAQQVTVNEPDTTAADLLYVVGGGNTLNPMPLETGEVKEHKNLIGQITSVISDVGDATGIIGEMAGVIGSNPGAILSGVKVMNTAFNVSSLADITNHLASVEGHDFTYDNPNSSCVIENQGKDINIIANLRCENKEAGIALFKVVRFTKTKNDRRLRWFQTKAALINTDKSNKADKAGYLSFGFSNYGEHSSLLTIPAKELKSGEYGVYCLANMFGPSTAILCYTFSVK